MKKVISFLFVVSLAGLTTTGLYAQVAINNSAANPNSSAVLDLNTGNTFTSPNGKGLLIPNVALTGSGDVTTIASPATSLLVYVPAGSGLTPAGYYYWTGTLWASVGNSWQLTGNAGTTVGTNFIGTTDANPLEIKVNNTISGYIDYNAASANASFGYQALAVNTGISNCAFGYQVLTANTTGGSNTAMGYKALTANTSGVDNTANGVTALYHNTSGNFNSAFGLDALQDNLTGIKNVAIGVSAIRFNNSGSSNTATGYDALFNNTTDANTATGDSALYNNTSGTDNVANGYAALALNTTGSNNSAFGFNAGPSSGALTNTTALGNGASVSTSNTIVLGNNTVTSLQCNVQTITALSDGRFKKDIKTDVHGLDFIMKLTPVSYHLNITKLNAFKKVKDADRQSVLAAEAVMQNGFIAQDVEKAAKAINYDFPGLKTPQNDSDTYGLGYTDFVMPLVKAVQEQEDTILALKAQIELLRNENKQQALSQARMNQQFSQEISELKGFLLTPKQEQATVSINK